jgi:hypothetical protein
MYDVNANRATSSTNYASWRLLMEQAALALFDQATKDAVGCAYAAIKVGTVPATCGGTPPPPPPPGCTLTNGVAVTGLADSVVGNFRHCTLSVPTGQTSLAFEISGGTGDADMYVRFGAEPTTTTYECRPYLSGNTEKCTISNIQAGTYYVSLRAYSAYSGVTLKGTHGGGTTGDPYIPPSRSLSGATGSAQYFRVAIPSGKKATITISGGTGDADLYTRAGSRPTTTTYQCRPYLNGNNETCTTPIATTAGDTYIMVRGYTAFSNVTLNAVVQ